MTEKESKRFSGKKIKLALGLTLSLIFLLAYIGCSILYISYNTDSLQTIFTVESHYGSDQNHNNSSDIQLPSKDKAISVLSLTEDQVLYDIDSRISDSVEKAGKEMNQQTEKDIIKDESADTAGKDNESTDTSSSSQTVEASPPASDSVESGLLHMINHIRSSRGLQTLISNPVLNNIARSRSQDMINRGYFSHYTPEGKNIGMILQENGIMYACSAENLSQASPPSWGSPETIINLWMGSSLHRANLLNPHFGQLGIGVIDAGGRRVVTLILMNR